MKCNKCGNQLKDNDIVAWKCNSCGKAFKFNVSNLMQFRIKKDKMLNQSILKCSSCGNWIDDGNENIFIKCSSCGNVMHGNLQQFNSYINVTQKKDESNLFKCPDCEKLISKNAMMCPFCGCPLRTKEKIKNKLFNKISLKILIPIAIIFTIAFTGFGMYYVKVERPKKIYNKAIALSEEGKYNEANDLFNTIPDYEDVEEIQNQLKYESHAYAAINCVKECLKNPDSFQLYKIYFFSSNKKDFSTEINNEKRLNATNMQYNENEDDSQRPSTCLVYYGAQNGFGGTTEGYAFCFYNSRQKEYMVFATCDSLDENNYNEYDPDEVEDLKNCRFINYYLENIDMVGDIDMDRLRTVLKNDSYSNIEIIE